MQVCSFWFMYNNYSDRGNKGWFLILFLIKFYWIVRVSHLQKLIIKIASEIVRADYKKLILKSDDIYENT